MDTQSLSICCDETITIIKAMRGNDVFQAFCGPTYDNVIDGIEKIDGYSIEQSERVKMIQVSAILTFYRLRARRKQQMK